MLISLFRLQFHLNLGHKFTGSRLHAGSHVRALRRMLMARGVLFEMVDEQQMGIVVSVSQTIGDLVSADEV